MSARESWTKSRAQRQEQEEGAPSKALALPEPMNAGHRCDRCGARAYVRVLFRGHHELLFCVHHYRRHAPALAEVAIGIQDETGRLAVGELRGSRR